MPTPRTLWRLALVAAALPACTSHTTEVIKTPLGRETRVMPRLAVPAPTGEPPPGDAPTLGADWTPAPGLLRGRLRWLDTCQRVDVQLTREEEIKTTETDTPGTLIGMGIGAAIAAASIWLLTDADSYDDTERCSEDDGEVSCTSDREAAYGVGFLGTLVGVSGAAYGVYALLQPPTEEILSSREDIEILERHPTEVTCGNQPIHGLGLEVQRVGQTIARSTTNDASEVAFAIPPDVTGALQVVVDAVPPHLVAWVRAGDVVGEVVIEP